MRSIAAIGLLLLVCGCAGNLAELRKAAPTANDFPSALAAEYLAYADSEKEQGRTGTAERFAAKGLKASKGEIVAPDTVDASHKQLSDARAELVTLLTPDVEHVAPQKAARAQLLFDCWAEQVAKKLAPREATCADGYEAAIADVRKVAGDFVHSDLGPHIIEFDEGVTALDQDDKDVIKEVLGELKGHANYLLELQVQHDSSAEPNDLTPARVQAITDAFVKAGIHTSRISSTTVDVAKVVNLSNDENVKNGDQIDVVIKAGRPLSGGRP